MKQLLMVFALVLAFGSTGYTCGRSSDNVLYRIGTTCYNYQSEYTIKEILVKTIASARDRFDFKDKLELDVHDLGRHIARYYLTKKLKGEDITLRDVIDELGIGNDLELNLQFKGLYINDERVEVTRENVVRAALKVAGFILDIETDGSVSYSYSLTYDGMPITRFTYIRNNSVYLNTEVHGGLPAPVVSAKIGVLATENEAGTLIQTTLTVTARDKPRVFNGIANRVVVQEVGKFHGKGFRRAKLFVNESERGNRSARIATSIIDVLSEGGFRIRVLGR